MSVLPIGISGETQYQISRSLRFNSSDSSHLNRTPSSAGSRTTWTWSGWVKRSALGTSQNIFASSNDVGNDYCSIQFFSSDIVRILASNSGSQVMDVYTSQVFRDVSSWYHFVIAIDTTQATASNRVKFYVNGVQVTNFGTSSYPSQNLEMRVNSTNPHIIGAGGVTSFVNYLSGYLTEVNFIDGQALTPSSFGETDPITGVWKPKKYTGTYGTNGFYLNFSDNSGVTATTLGKDYSGNGNNWTPNNFSVTAGAGNDSLVDVPTLWGSDTGAGGEVRGNYATLNPLRNNTSNTLSNGNLDVTSTTGSFRSTLTTIGVSSGKWYWEVLCNTISGSNNRAIIGIGTSASNKDVGIGNSTFGYGYYSENGNKYHNDTFTSFGNSYQSGDVIGFALNMDAGTCVVYKNNVSQGTLASSLTGEWFPAVGILADSGTSSISCNFGQRPFAYTAPIGFKALCTTNLPEPTIKQGDDYFNAVAYNGNGTSQSITGVGFKPDFLWLKSRSDTSGNHGLYDVIRGVSARLITNSTNAEDSTAITSFDTDGFTLGTAYNSTPNSLISWAWKANGTGVTNTAGTITSTVSANTTSGFSIVTYTGTGTTGTVGHGLGVAPQFYIVKSRSNTVDWYCYHVGIGATNRIQLNQTNALSSSGLWNNTAPTSTVFSIAGGFDPNLNNYTYVAYCFAPVAGFSAFGSYTGNGSTDGPFVFTNHRPAYVLIKRTDAAGSWTLLDSKRLGYNVTDSVLRPNTSDAEFTGNTTLDIVSNGFKIRSTWGDVNASGGTYIYAAFAENPVKYSLAR